MMLIFKIKDGKVDKHTELFELLDKDGSYIIKEHRETRSINQNAYLHALFTKIAEDVGDDMEYIKYYFKEKHLKKYSIRRNVEYVWDTRSLDTKECWIFIDKVLNDMAVLWYIYMSPSERKKSWYVFIT